MISGNHIPSELEILQAREKNCPQPSYLSNPQEIANRCEEFQEGWNHATRQRRITSEVKKRVFAEPAFE